MPMAHFVLSVVGFLVMAPSLSLMLLGHLGAMPFLAVSEIMLVASMLLFVIIVFMATMKKPAPAV
jgi:hypothetical protein